MARTDGLSKYSKRRPSAYAISFSVNALGRRLEYFDKPSVRAIVRNAAAENYRWSVIVRGIVTSTAFLQRESKAN